MAVKETLPDYATAVSSVTGSFAVKTLDTTFFRKFGNTACPPDIATPLFTMEGKGKIKSGIIYNFPGIAFSTSFIRMTIDALTATSAIISDLLALGLTGTANHVFRLIKYDTVNNILCLDMLPEIEFEKNLIIHYTNKTAAEVKIYYTITYQLFT